MKSVSVFVNVDGNTVECETETDHLGHRVSSQGSDTLIKSAINSFWRGFNLFAAEFGHIYGFVKCNFIQTILLFILEFSPLGIKW